MTKKATNAPTASEELRFLIERWERLQEEKEGIAADQKDVMAEAKGRGYDPKTIREIIKLRKMSPEDRREREALLDTYKAALGMLDGTPLGKWALDRLEKTDDEPAPADIDEPTYAAAVAKVIEAQNASTSWLQRMLKIGYNTAVALIERMEREGVVSTPNHVGARTLLRGADGTPSPEPEEQAPPLPEPTVDDARRLGGEAANAGAPVTANPFPARDPRRAAWDEAWCMALGTDGMDIPDALKPTPKAKKPDGGEGGSASE